MTTINITKKTNEIEFLPRVECADGFSFSMQASDGHYCTPRDNNGSYTAVELGYPSSEDSLISEFAEIYKENHDLTDAVYPYVPSDIVIKLVEKHGGVADNTPRISCS